MDHTNADIGGSRRAALTSIFSVMGDNVRRWCFTAERYEYYIQLVYSSHGMNEAIDCVKQLWRDKERNRQDTAGPLPDRVVQSEALDECQAQCDYFLTYTARISSFRWTTMRLICEHLARFSRALTEQVLTGIERIIVRTLTQMN